MSEIKKTCKLFFAISGAIILAVIVFWAMVKLKIFEFVEPMPRDAKVFWQYQNEKYNICNKGDTYFLCYNGEVKASTKLNDQVEDNYYEKNDYFPYVLSETGNLYMLRADISTAKLEFIQIDTACEALGEAENYETGEFFKIYQKNGKMYLVVVESQTVADGKYQVVEMTEDKLKARLVWIEENACYNVAYSFFYEGINYEGIHGLPMLKGKAKVSNPYLYDIIEEKDEKAYKTLKEFEKEIPYADLEKHKKEVQQFLDLWEKEHIQEIYEVCKKNPENLLSKGAKEWLNLHPEYKQELFYELGKYCCNNSYMFQ